MRYANASFAFMVNADMRWTELSNADLSHANLSGADLSHTALGYAHLEGADLKHAKGLTKSHLEKAKTNEYTLLPADLPP